MIISCSWPGTDTLIFISLLVILFNSLASVIFLQEARKALIDIAAVISICFDTVNAIKQIRICNCMGSSLK